MNNKKSEFPYGPIVAAIAKLRNVLIKVYIVAPASDQGTYRGRPLQNLRFKLTRKGWVKVKDPDSEEDPVSEKGKEKLVHHQNDRQHLESLLV